MGQSLPSELYKKIIPDPDGPTTWETRGGKYTTTHVTTMWFKLAEFTPNRQFIGKFRVDDTKIQDPPPK